MNTEWKEGRIAAYLVDAQTGEVLEEVTRVSSGLYVHNGKRYFTLTDAKRAAEKELGK